MENMIKLHTENFDAVHTEVSSADLDGTPVLRITKSDKINLFDQNTYAKISDLEFHNGVIECRLLSRLLPNAPDFARGFIGIVFRTNSDNSEFESFYVRPTNGRNCTDAVRKAHGCQYFSFPGYTFDYFREFGITEYEAPVNLALDEWFTLKAVISDEQGAFYINEQRVLTVTDMKHGKGKHGSVGIFVDIGTEAFVSEMKVICED